MPNERVNEKCKELKQTHEGEFTINAIHYRQYHFIERYFKNYLPSPRVELIQISSNELTDNTNVNSD